MVALGEKQSSMLQFTHGRRRRVLNCTVKNKIILSAVKKNKIYVRWRTTAKRYYYIDE